MEKVTEKPKFKFPTEVVELPSKGLIYPKDNPLSSGKVYFISTLPLSLIHI